MKTNPFATRSSALIFVLLASIICCSRLYSADCVPVPVGLVSWWPAEGNAFDAGVGNNGLLWGNATFGPGRVGQGFVFNGSMGAVTLGSPANLQLQDFTIEAWIRRANATVASFGSHGAGRFFGYGSFGYSFGIWNDGRLFLSKVETDDVSTSSSITNTDFHHVAVTKSGTTVTFYIDGVATSASGYGATFSFLTGVALGARPDIVDDTFLGTIDELAIYNRALDPGEILAIYSNGAGKCRTLFSPVITLQPASATNYASETVSFKVVATGDAPLFYQWRFNDAELDGKSAASLALTNVQLTNAGTYTVVVTNAGGSTTSSPAVLVVNPPPPCAPIAEGLVSWWRGEGNSLDSWSGKQGYTQFGFGFAQGKVGQAFNFNSSFLFVPQSLSLVFTNGLTIEAWVNPSSLTGSVPHTIFTKLDSTLGVPLANQGSYFLGTTSNGLVMFSLGSGLPGTSTALISSEVLPTNQWSFVAATYDGADMRIYINSRLATNQNYSGGIFQEISDLAIGGIPPGPIRTFPSGFLQADWTWSGLLDEISLYNRALSQDEVQGIYSADLTGKCLAPPLITGQPQSQSIPLGEDVLYSATILGSRPMTFQWRLNGVNVPGATNDTLLLEKVQTSQAGSYSVAATNAVGFAISSNAVLTLLPRPSCVAEPSGRISWWPADGSGLDVSGSNTAIVSTSPLSPSVLYATGKNGQAFNFTNISTSELSNTRVVVTNSPSLNFGSNADFSIEAWIKAAPPLFLNGLSFPPFAEPTSEPLFRTILDKRDRLLNSVGYSLLLNGGRLACSLGVAPSPVTNTTMFVSDGPDLRDGMFHHVAVSLNRSATNGCYLLVDGQVVLNFDARSRKGSLSNNASLLIGGPPGVTQLPSTSFIFHGLIDELAIYNRALSPTEVLAIRQAGAAGKCKTLPSITRQPVNQRVTLASNVTFSVSAAGVPPLRYQWLRNGSTISGATNSSCTFVVLPTSGGLYSVRVTNVFGSTTSFYAALTVNTVSKALDQIISLNEDTPTGITLHGTDAESDHLIYSIVMPPAHGSISGVAPNLIYTPNPNYFGPDSFTFKVNDGLADSAPAIVNITVLPVNDAPVANAQSISVNEDTPINITLTATDVDNDLLTYSVATPPAHGTLSGMPPNLSYLGFTNYNGADSFTFRANDGQTDSAPATVNITVIPVNDAPVAVVRVSPVFAISADETNLFILSVNNTNANAVLDGSASSDVESDPLTYLWLEGTNVLATGVNVTNSFGIGPHQISLQVSDGKDIGSDQTTFEVITPAESVGRLVTIIEESTLGHKAAQPLEVSLKAAAASFNAGRSIPAINQLQAFENKVRAQVFPADPAMAAELIHAAQEIIDRISPP